jgi:hypothetical protein
MFSASLIFICKSDDEQSRFIDAEEQIVLLNTESEEEAIIRCAVIGKANELRYEAADGGKVRWNYMGVTKLFEIDDSLATDGAEVFSRFLGDVSMAEGLFKIIHPADPPAT